MNSKIHRGTFITASVGGIIALAGCSKTTSSDKPVWTGKNVSVDYLYSVIGYFPYSDKFSSDIYELVDYNWLTTKYYDIFKQRLYNEGITKWDFRANCTIFTEEYIAGLQRMYYRDHFHSWSKAMKLAAGEFWFKPDGSKEGHSVVLVVTEHGPVYIEPQNGSILNLTAEQINSRYLRKL